MRVNVYSEKGIKTGTTDLPKELFEAKGGEPALRQYLRVYGIRQRRGTAKTKTRAEVRGGGRKPWAQKGTGRARHGSIRSPLWVGGGVAHGPRPREFEAAIPWKIRLLALKRALSDKASQGKVYVIADWKAKEPKTAAAAKLLARLKLHRPLVVLPSEAETAWRSFRNLPEAILATTINPYEVIAARELVIFKEALSKMKPVTKKVKTVKAESRSQRLKNAKRSSKSVKETKVKRVGAKKPKAKKK